MNTRRFAGSAMALLMLPVGATAQSLAGSDPHPDVHLYAAADFGIDPGGGHVHEGYRAHPAAELPGLP